MARDTIDQLHKILIIGDSGAGKSCLLLRFADDRFPDKRLTTIGIDFKVKNISLDGHKIKLQIWDTAGQERYRTITQAYYRSAMGVLLVYDCANIKSFQNCKSWLKQLEEHASSGISKVLVGNKCDLQPLVSRQEVVKLCDEFELQHLETSALKGTNVDQCFHILIKKIISKQESSTRGQDGGVPPDLVTRRKGPLGQLDCCVTK